MDFDVHGIVRIRLLDAAAGDCAAVARQLGLAPSPLGCEPDVKIRFVSAIRTAQPVYFLGRDEAGFTDDAFLILRSRHRTGVRVRIPFDRIGRGCEIVCQSGVPAVPLLIPIINLTALAKGALPVHASAFNYRGAGVLCTGWSKGGKTETLLAFMARGAEYVGDEWVYIAPDGQRLFGIPEPIRLWDWHLRSLPRLRQRIRRVRRLRLSLLKTLLGIANRTRPGMLDRAKLLLTRQLHVDISPLELFGAAACTMAGNFDQLVFVGSHESPRVTVNPVDPGQVAERMLHSLGFERQEFMAYYRMFRFAFPQLANPLIDQADHLSREALSRVLADKPAYQVLHPYPVSIPALFDELSPYISSSVRRDREYAGIEYVRTST